MVYCTYNYSIHGVYKPTNITGGHHIVANSKAVINKATENWARTWQTHQWVICWQKKNP